MSALPVVPDAVVRVIADHLWQSTLVAAAAAGLCMVLRGASARLRCTLLVVGSLKFLVPFALLAAAGAALPWPPPRVITLPVPADAPALELPTSVAHRGESPPAARPPEESRRLPVSDALLAIWIAGSLVVLVRRIAAARPALAARRRASRLDDGRVAAAFARAGGPTAGVALRSSPDCGSPCVVGLRRPVLLWPSGMGDDLDDAQLEAIVAHEMAHVRRRDNLMAAMHAVVESLFWFHPIVWWIGARLGDERERACDEAVLAAGAAPEIYADGILKVCERSLGAPAVGVANITGSTLTQRIEAIMTAPAPRPIGRLSRTLLGIAVIGLLAGPFAAGAASRTTQVAPPGIRGVVTDQMGGTMSGVAVTVSGDGYTRTVTTGDQGEYVVIGVPPGEYRVQFAQSGFKMHRVERVIVRGDADAIVNAQMDIGALSEALSITAQADTPTPADPSAPAEEARLLQQVAAAPDEPHGHQLLAAFYYRQERFEESAAAMRRAADLIAQRAGELSSTYTLTLPTGGKIKEPKKIRDVKPVYPEIARTARVKGVVILEAIVATDGTVRDVRVLRSVPLLDAAAVGAVRQWLFTPTLLNGVPVDVILTASVSFELREGVR